MHKNVKAVVEAARELGLEINPSQFPEGTRTAQDAADAIGVELGQIVKSLVFLADGQPVLALVSGDNRLDEQALSEACGGATIARADANAVREATGFPVGGVPPLGPKKLPTYIDADLLRFDEVWAAAGTPHDNFASDPRVLAKAVGGHVVAIGVR